VWNGFVATERGAPNAPPGPKFFSRRVRRPRTVSPTWGGCRFPRIARRGERRNLLGNYRQGPIPPSIHTTVREGIFPNPAGPRASDDESTGQGPTGPRARVKVYRPTCISPAPCASPSSSAAVQRGDVCEPPAPGRARRPFPNHQGKPVCSTRSRGPPSESAIKPHRERARVQTHQTPRPPVPLFSGRSP